MSDDEKFELTASIIGNHAVAMTVLSLFLKKGLITRDEALSHFSAALASMKTSGAPKPAIAQMEIAVRGLGGVVPSLSGSSH